MENVSSRILKETNRLRDDPIEGINVQVDEHNWRLFHVTISGPADTPYENGFFNLELFLPAEYPMAPPMVRLTTPIFHPNIDRIGRICIDILKEAWIPALNISIVLLSVQALLSSPNPNDPLLPEVAEAWILDKKQAHLNAKKWTEIYASKANAFCK